MPSTRACHAILPLVLCLSAPAVFAQEPAQGAPGLSRRPGSGPDVVVVAGTAIVRTAPDRALITLAAEARARSPRDAQRQTSQVMTAVQEQLNRAGLGGDAVRTMSIDLQPEFDYANGKQSLRGYVARNAIQVRVDDVSRVGEIVDLAVGAGAGTVGNVSFDLKDRASAEREALRLATVDGRGRADAIAAGAGRAVDRVIRIEEPGVPGPEPRPAMMEMRAQSADMTATPVAPGQIEIRARVVVTASLRP